VYAPKPLLLRRCRLHFTEAGEKERKTERKEHGRSCSALEQFLDAYCHALLSLESIAITGQLGYRCWSEGRRAEIDGAEGNCMFRWLLHGLFGLVELPDLGSLLFT